MTEQEQRQAIRQILFDANDICQATPCENEYCIYHGDYRCYDNVIVDKLIKAGYGDVSEYKTEIERLKNANSELTDNLVFYKDKSYKLERSVDKLKTEIEKEVKQAKIDVLNEVKERIKTAIDTYYNSDEEGEGYFIAEDTIEDIDELIKEVQK